MLNPEQDEPPISNVLSYNWLSIIDMLGLCKNPIEFETCNLMGKKLPQFEMWECFLNAYLRGVVKIMGFFKAWS